jgi:hypothetical protein
VDGAESIGIWEVYPLHRLSPLGTTFPVGNGHLYLRGLDLDTLLQLVYFEESWFKHERGSVSGGDPRDRLGERLHAAGGQGLHGLEHGSRRLRRLLRSRIILHHAYQNTTLYAIWGTQVLYDLNGGSGHRGMGQRALTAVVKPCMRKPSPSSGPPRLAFDGWAPIRWFGWAGLPRRVLTVGSTNFDSAPIISMLVGSRL